MRATAAAAVAAAVAAAARRRRQTGGNGGNGGGANNASAVFDGRNLFIKLQCFGVSKRGKCWDRATALKSKGGTRYTFPIQRVVKAKKGKVIRARVRFQYRKELERRTRSPCARSSAPAARTRAR